MEIDLAICRTIIESTRDVSGLRQTMGRAPRLASQFLSLVTQLSILV